MMAWIFIRSAMGMNKSIGGGARSIRGFSSATQGVTDVEKLKEMGIGSVEKKTVHQVVHGIKMAREDKMFQKATRAWLMAGLVLGGFTFASTLVAEADSGGMETGKEQEEQ